MFSGIDDKREQQRILEHQRGLIRTCENNMIIIKNFADQIIQLDATLDYSMGSRNQTEQK
jgi:endo-alpha-1,4-polygalactosaminidase (GH114 family)